MIYCNQELGHKASQRAMRKKNRKNRKRRNTKNKNQKKLTVVNECLTPKSLNPNPQKKF